MGYKIVDKDGEVVGWSADWFEAGDGLRLIDDAEHTEINIDALRAARTARIKEEVLERLNAMAWRIDRAKERDLIGASGESLSEVYAAREAVRIAGNRAEEEVQEIETAQDIRAYEWQVTDADYPKPSKITRLAFVRRFTTDERATLSAAREQNQALDDWWKLLDLAINVNLKDPEIMTGVHYLEKVKLLKKGRAKEILTP